MPRLDLKGLARAAQFPDIRTAQKLAQTDSTKLRTHPAECQALAQSADTVTAGTSPWSETGA